MSILGSIPTIVLLLIYIRCRQKKNRNKQLEKTYKLQINRSNAIYDQEYRSARKPQEPGVPVLTETAECTG